MVASEFQDRDLAPFCTKEVSGELILLKLLINLLLKLANPRNHCSSLIVVAILDAMLTDDVNKVVNGVIVELTLLELQVQMELSKFLKDLHHVVAMVSQVPGVNEDFVDTDDDETVEELPENLVRESLEYRG